MTTTQNDLIYDTFALVGNPDGWNPQHQQENFAQLIHLANLCNHPLTQSRVLDVGCGTGKLYEFLQPHNIRDYLGIDIYKPSIATASKIYPSAKFLNQNILQPSAELATPFDYIFCSGALTTKVSDNYTFLEQMVQQIDQLATHGIYFNFLTQMDEDNADWLFAYDPSKVEAICHTLQKKIKLVHNPTQQEAHVFLTSRE